MSSVKSVKQVSILDELEKATSDNGPDKVASY
jgi:hypothetical protein